MTTSDTTEANRALVLKAITGVFVERDPTVLDRLFSRRLSPAQPQIPDGTDAIKAVMSNWGRSSSKNSLRRCEGDLVMVHGRLHGWDRSR